MALRRLAAGEMRQRIRIMRETQTKDARGNITKVWAEIARPWAKVEGIDGREAVLGQALQGVSTYRIRIWWRQDQPTGLDQIKLDTGRDLNVRSCTDPFGDRRELSILADTGQAQATS